LKPLAMSTTSCSLPITLTPRDGKSALSIAPTHAEGERLAARLALFEYRVFVLLDNFHSIREATRALDRILYFSFEPFGVVGLGMGTHRFGFQG
jgi:hypothetical protein